MKRFTKVAVALGALGAAIIVPAVPASSVARAPMGYTVINGDGSCDLATLDLVTGTLTDLPAASSPDACAIDLAAAPNGTVYGVGFGGGSTPVALGGNLAQATEAGTLITYAADGTATSTLITVENGSEGGMAYGGIAVSASGTVYVHLVTDEPGCDTGAPSPTTTLAAAPQYAGDSVCLYTVDPGTGVATLVGTTGLFETPFFGLSWCSGLTTISIGYQSFDPRWGTESSSTGEVTQGPAVVGFPTGYDCDVTTGGPLWSLQSPNTQFATAQGTEVVINTVDPATGALTEIAPVSDSAADLMGLAVVSTPEPAPTTTIDVANANEVAPAFTG